MSDQGTYNASGDKGLAGGGRLTYRIEGARETLGRGLDLDIRTAIENRNARYFGNESRAGPKKLVLINHKVKAIQEAVDELNDGRRNCSGVAYQVDEPYYPDEYDHLVDLRDVPVDELSSAFQGAQAELLKRGFFVNSIRTDDHGRLIHLHVVRKRSADETRAHGLRKQEEKEDA